MTTIDHERAARLGIETEYWDALGQRRFADAEAFARMADALEADQGSGGGLDRGSDAPFPSASQRAYQGADDLRVWALAVQLYGVRSRRNWGHGDFTDLAALVDLAAEIGAAGIGLNPLHALFHERAEASPYSPNSRLFLNARYIDVEAVAEFPGLVAAGFATEVEELRRRELIDYAGVAATKEKALRLAYEAFRRSGSEDRRREFEDFRRRRGAPLSDFAAFEWLRSRWPGPWMEWPAEWRRPDVHRLRALRDENEPGIAYFEFVQWIAHQQLEACRQRALARGLPIGLYLDVAVGTRPDGFDAWSEPAALVSTIEIGAPPDLLNTAGQKWGLAGVNPIGLDARGYEPFRRVLHASMSYAGAIRLDHVMALHRQFLVPNGMSADRGMYVRSPFAALLAATTAESLAQRCLVIGEDLGTVPADFRKTLADWGIWSYHVMMFERTNGGGFRAPEDYRDCAIATFATHDLPTLAGWLAGVDLDVKRSLGMDPGETAEQRRAACAALSDALAARGLACDFLGVARYLAAARSKLVMISMEDAIGVVEQVNVPGTVDQYPNWRRRLPLELENLVGEGRLAALADAMASAGRSIRHSRPYAGHPRLSCGDKEVDGRDEPGHDGSAGA